jgi:hypothetical protein
MEGIGALRGGVILGATIYYCRKSFLQLIGVQVKRCHFYLVIDSNATVSHTRVRLVYGDGDG